MMVDEEDLLLPSACSNMHRGRRGHDTWSGSQKPSRVGDGTLHTDDLGRVQCESLPAVYHFINKIVGTRKFPCSCSIFDGTGKWVRQI